jgi:hypothetical protein
MIEMPKLILPNFNFSFVLNKPTLMVVFVLFALFYSIITFVLMYHWSRYGMKSHGIFVAHTLFVTVSLVLFGVSGLALVYM